MELNDTQLKNLATKARSELSDEQVVAAYLLCSNGTSTAHEEKAPRATAPKRERSGGSVVERVLEDVKAHPETSVGQIRSRIGVEERIVSQALQALKKRGLANGVGGKRDMKWSAIGE
jgi:ribosomal protein S25